MSFNPAMLVSATAAFPTDIDTVTITRTGSGPTPTVTTIYSGGGDLQEGSGDIYYNPAGAVEEIDARLFIDLTIAGGTLPSVEVDDRVTYGGDGKKFAVVAVAYKPFVFPYLEILLKRGPLKYDQAK